MADLFSSHHTKMEGDDDLGDPFSAPASMSQQNDQYVENDIPNGNNNGGMLVIGEDDLLIKKVIEENDFLKPQDNNVQRAVLPFESGEGLPYAPVDWPSPGDVWTWRVGRRFHYSTGFFQDRFLFPPQRFQTLGKGKLCFGSKAAVEKYIRSEFPDADVDAFFASFTWKIPVKYPSPTKEAATFNLEVPPPDETGEVKEEKEEFYQSGRKKRKQSAPPVQQNAVASLSTQNVDASASTPKRRTRMPKRNGAASPPKQKAAVSSSTSTRKTRRLSKQSTSYTGNNEGHAIQPEQPVINVVIPEDFDNYLSSLEDILTKPLSEAPASYSVTTDSPAVAEDEMAEARRKLSSLLVMDFPSLVQSKKTISELLALSTKLRKDPRMSAEQLVKLKLIEEIPSFSEVFLDSRETINQVNKYFAALESNKGKVISLKNEYNELKEKADHLQSQVDSNLLAVQEIDKQIAQLQSWRAELTNTIETNKAAKVEVTSAQTVVANEIPTVVLEIQRSNSKMPEWELKKTNAEKREAEILAKFTPLKGFSL